jgi:hypothetical protein
MVYIIVGLSKSRRSRRRSRRKWRSRKSRNSSKNVGVTILIGCKNEE